MGFIYVVKDWQQVFHLATGEALKIFLRVAASVWLHVNVKFA